MQIFFWFFPRRWVTAIFYDHYYLTCKHILHLNWLFLCLELLRAFNPSTSSLGRRSIKLCDNKVLADLGPCFFLSVSCSVTLSAFWSFSIRFPWSHFSPTGCHQVNVINENFHLTEMTPKFGLFLLMVLCGIGYCKSYFIHCQCR